MCAPKQETPKSVQPPAPEKVADKLSIDPSKKRDPLAGQRSGKSSLVIQRNVGGLDGASGLNIGR